MKTHADALKHCDAFASMRLLTQLLLVACTGACGGGGSGAPTGPPAQPAPSPSVPPSTSIVATGANWSFRVEGFEGVGITGTLGGRGFLAALEGSFDVSGDTVTAVVEALGGCFRPSDQRLRFTGTRSGSTVQLQSQQVNGQVVRLDGTLSAAGDSLQGTFSIAGGCGSGSTGQIKGRAVDLNGVWKGNFGSIPAVVDLKMAPAPDADGNYELSGSVKFSDTQCFPDAVFTRRARGRILFPDVVSGGQRLELIAEVTEDASTMCIIYVLVSGTCNELRDGDGVLVRQ